MQVHPRIWRILPILVAVLTYCLLLAADAVYFFAAVGTSLLAWGRFGLSALYALMFLAVGALVWFYARDRRVAGLLFCACTTMMAVFAVETASVQGNPPAFFPALAGACATLGLLALALFVLLFPNNLLARFRLPARAYVAVLVPLSILAAVDAVVDTTHLVVGWLYDITSVTPVLAVVGILVTVVISYRQASSAYARQQARFLVFSLVLTFAFFLCLTLLPDIVEFLRYAPSNQALAFQDQPDGQIGSLLFILLPLAFGYSMLRSQILLFDRTIRRAVYGIVRVTLTAFGGALLLILAAAFSLPGTGMLLVFIAGLFVLIPALDPVSRGMADWLFSPERTRAHAAVYEPQAVLPAAHDLRGIAHQIASIAANALETDEVGLFILDEASSAYWPVATYFHKEQVASLVRRVEEVLCPTPLPPASFPPDWVDQEGRTGIACDTPGIRLLQLASKRHAVYPVLLALLNQALLMGQALNHPTPIPSVLIRGADEGAGPLLLPIWAGGTTMIGMLTLGERRGSSSYGGPDFHILELLLERFTLPLNIARLLALSAANAALLEALGQVDRDAQEASSPEEIMYIYLQAAQRIWHTDGVQFWRYIPHEDRLYPARQLGIQSPLDPRAYQSADWEPRFTASGDSQLGTSEALAWLPLLWHGERLGMLLLIYDRPHRFTEDEQEMLPKFARHCAAAVASRLHTQNLQQGLLKVQEFSRLKDEVVRMTTHDFLSVLQRVGQLLGQLQQASANGEAADQMASRLHKHALLAESFSHPSHLAAGVSARRNGGQAYRAVLATGIAILEQSIRGESLAGTTGPGEEQPFLQQSLRRDINHLLNQFLPTPHILVVTAEPALGEMLCDAMRSEGYEPMAFAAGQEALDWLVARNQPDVTVPLVLLLERRALGMSLADFWRVLQQCWQGEALPPVILLDDEEALGAAEDPQGVLRLVLPLSLQQLFAALRLVLPE